MLALIWMILTILFIVWILGLGLNWSSWIWGVFLAAVALLVYGMFAGRRAHMT